MRRGGKPKVTNVDKAKVQGQNKKGKVKMKYEADNYEIVFGSNLIKERT